MEQKIEIINNWNLGKIFNELENGNIKIPKFQRDYVWERSKVVKLLNSIFNQYPIGSFFIWVTSNKYKDFCREIEELNFPPIPESNYYHFILDGQQRITSLYVSLKGKKLNNIDFSSICFNLEKQIFQVPRIKNEKHNIPIWKLLNLTEYGKIYADYISFDKENNSNYAITWMNCQQIFTNYPISLIKTLKTDLDEAVTIFERINQGGKKLSLFDLVQASTWSEDFDLRDRISFFNKEIQNKNFGRLENEIFIQSLSLNVFDDCRNQHQLRLTSESCNKIWEKTVECIKLTIDYIKQFGVKFSDYIPYNSFIPIIQYYFFKSGLKNVNISHSKYIEDWFWSATFSQRFSSSSLSLMKEDANWICELANDKFIENIFDTTLSYKELRKVRMQDKSVIKNGVLCLMALKNPKDFHNGQNVILDKSNVSRSNSKENHHFFPLSLKKEFGTDDRSINSLLNFALISTNLNREISNSIPSEYLQKYTIINAEILKHLETHFIDEEAYRFALANNFELFLEKRGKLILDEIFNKIGKKGRVIADNEIDENNIEFEEEFINEDIENV